MIPSLPKKKTPIEPEKEMSFLEHLEELRWHIIRSLAAIVFFAIITFIAKEFVFDEIIFAPRNADFFTYRFFCGISEHTCIQPNHFDIIPRELGEQFFTHLKVSFWLGLIIAFPYVFFELWRFIKPGLHPKEQKAARGSVFICSTLFLLGVLFGYYILSPFAIRFLGGYQVGINVINSTSLASYVNYMTMFVIPTGIVFELPVVIYFLSKIGLVTPEFLRKYRKHSIVFILILSAIITPPDVITQVLISIPIVLLYEVGIYISKMVVKKANQDL